LNNHIESATLHSNSYGVITYENNRYEVHIWEDEDQVRGISELSKRYPTILLNGLTTDNQTKNTIIHDINKLLKKQNISEEIQVIINKLFQSLI
jgi:hypothetical protein